MLLEQTYGVGVYNYIFNQQWTSGKAATKSCGLILMYLLEIKKHQRQTTLEVSLFCQHHVFSSEQMIISVLCSKTVQPSKQNKSNRNKKKWTGNLPNTKLEVSQLGREVYFISRAAFCYAVCNSRANTVLTKCRIHILAHKLEFNVSIQQMISYFQLAEPQLVSWQLAL